MITHATIRSVLALSVLVVSGLTWADTQPNEKSAVDKPAMDNPSHDSMPKDDWLGKIKVGVSKPICDGFFQDVSIGKQLNEKNIKMDQCLSNMPALTDLCIKKYYDSLPSTITEDVAQTWGKKIGECIGMEFAKQYLYPDASSATSAPASTVEPSPAIPSKKE